MLQSVKTLLPAHTRWSMHGKQSRFWGKESAVQAQVGRGNCLLHSLSLSLFLLLATAVRRKVNVPASRYVSQARREKERERRVEHKVKVRQKSALFNLFHSLSLFLTLFQSASHDKRDNADQARAPDSGTHAHTDAGDMSWKGEQ